MVCFYANLKKWLQKTSWAQMLTWIAGYVQIKVRRREEVLLIANRNCFVSKQQGDIVTLLYGRVSITLNILSLSYDLNSMMLWEN